MDRRWLQDTSKRKLADLSIVYARPPSLFPRANPRLTRRLIKTGAPDKEIGLFDTFCRVDPKKGEHAPGK